MVSTERAVGMALREDTWPLFCPPTLNLTKSHSINQDLILSSQHLTHLRIPQVLINITHFSHPQADVISCVSVG